MNSTPDQRKIADGQDFIPLSDAAQMTGYTPEYLNFLARTEKLTAKKIGRNWHTTGEWVRDYLDNKAGVETVAQKDDEVDKIEIAVRNIGNEKIDKEYKGKVFLSENDESMRLQLRDIAKQEYVINEELQKIDSEKDLEKLEANSLKKIKSSGKRRNIFFLNRKRRFAFMAVALIISFVGVDLAKFQIRRNKMASLEENYGIEKSTLAELDSGFVKGEETEIAGVSIAQAKSENYKARDVKIGGGLVILNYAEHVPLEISDIRSEAFTTKKGEEIKLLINWKTNKLALSEIEYAKNGGKNSRTLMEENYAYNHSVVLSRLQPGTSYVYTISAKDKWASQYKSDRYGAFTGSKEVSVIELIIKALEDVFGWAIKE